jgi:PleD family two-component response regulator
MTRTAEADARILIVDDCPDERRLHREILTKAGFSEPLMAADAREAFRLLGLDQASSGAEVDLILLDILMPGMDGLEVCRRIRAVERLRDIPIIMATVVSEVEALANALDEGATDYIAKPIRRLELLARIRAAVRLKRETDQRKAREQELARANECLQQAMRDIKTLRGLLPICAWCKRVRTEQGSWRQLEVYIQEHSEAQFAYGVCSECMV